MMNPIKETLGHLDVFKWWSELSIEKRYHTLILGIIIFMCFLWYIDKRDCKVEMKEMKDEHKEEMTIVNDRAMVKEAKLNGELKECQNSRFEDGNYFRDKYYELKSEIENN